MIRNFLAICCMSTETDADWKFIGQEPRILMYEGRENGKAIFQPGVFRIPSEDRSEENRARHAFDYFESGILNDVDYSAIYKEQMRSAHPDGVNRIFPGVYDGNKYTIETSISITVELESTYVNVGFLEEDQINIDLIMASPFLKLGRMVDDIKKIELYPSVIYGSALRKKDPSTEMDRICNMLYDHIESRLITK